MKEKKVFGKSFLIFFNPVIAVLYAVLCDQIYKLALYGDLNERLPLLLGILVFFLLWILFYIFFFSKIGKREKYTYKKLHEEEILSDRKDDLQDDLKVHEQEERKETDNSNMVEVEEDTNTNVDVESIESKEPIENPETEESESDELEEEITWIDAKKEKQKKAGKNSNRLLIQLAAALMFLVFLTITGLGVYGIYYASIPYNGKLAWELEKLNNKREIAYTHNNITTDGVKGLFDDLDESLTLPKTLYVAGNLELSYAKDGEITDFTATVFGKNKKNQTQSYTISYDKDKSDKIEVLLNEKLSDAYDASKNITPLFDILKVLSLKDATNGWEEDSYSILYRGKRNWGYDATGIYLLNQDGTVTQATKDDVPVVGYSVSVFIKGKESSVTPRRYVATWEKEESYKTSDTQDESAGKIKLVSGDDTQTPSTQTP